jgi:regulator of protease activity HflC (stomatin/prohibitin superfamily)
MAAISDQMMIYLDGKGIEIDAVLLKSIQLPASLARAIESKLEAEQQAQHMKFVLDQSRRQAEVRRIEAEGVRDAQIVISEGLDATDGDLPLLMDNSFDVTPKK